MSRPSLDHFVGRKVLEIRNNDEGVWEIVLEGGVAINSGQAGNQPKDHLFEGLILQMVILGAEATQLVFNNGDRIALDPLKYTIHTADQEPFNPQWPEERGDLPVDPSDERLADGPQEPVSDSETPDE